LKKVIPVIPSSFKKKMPNRFMRLAAGARSLRAVPAGESRARTNHIFGPDGGHSDKNNMAHNQIRSCPVSLFLDAYQELPDDLYYWEARRGCSSSLNVAIV
jgi:hypothetical protein